MGLLEKSPCEQETEDMTNYYYKKCMKLSWVERYFIVLGLLWLVYIIGFRCHGPTFLVKMAEKQTWRPVNREKTAFVFSAYLLEDRYKVVIIGAMTESPVNYICQLWGPSKDGNQTTMDRSYPTALTPPESHDRKYKVTLFECPYRTEKHPEYVSLIVNTCDEPSNLIRIQKTHRPASYQRTFTVCLSPLNFQYSNGYELIEWMELNRILGAEKFVFYNHSSAANVAQILDYYSKRGLAEVVQWRVPMAVDTYPVRTEPEIHYFAQSASLIDCLYRNKAESEFIVNIDLDEFIIPHTKGTKTWDGMLRNIDTKYAKAFTFKNTYFRKDWDQRNSDQSHDSTFDVRQSHLTTVNTFHRETKVYIKGVKSKYMARTDGLRYLMIHFVPDLPLREDVTVPENVALLHHYRYPEDGTNPTEMVFDYTVKEKFGQELVGRVEKVWKELSHVYMGPYII